MGRKSREKKQRREDGFSGKELKAIIRKSKPASVTTSTGHEQAFNPLKKLAKGKGIYQDETGNNVLSFTVQKYAAFLQQQKEKMNNENKGEE